MVQIQLQTFQSIDVFPDHLRNITPHLTSLPVTSLCLIPAALHHLKASLHAYLLGVCLPLLAWRLCKDRDFALSLAVSKGSG